MRSKMSRISAAAVLIAVTVYISQFGGEHNTVFAQVLGQIEKANTITWATTFYSQVTSKDGKETWIEAETRYFAYMEPGMYRDAKLDEDMQIEYLAIEDTVAMEKLSLEPQKKTAYVSELARASYDPRGPFVWVREHMQKHNLEWVEKKGTASGEVNVFRIAFRDRANNRDWSYDFWIDAVSKQLISVHVPGADIYDIEKDPISENPAEEGWLWEPVCFVQHDITFDAELDESLFSLEPPEGYLVKHMGRSDVNEADMIEYLGMLAEYNNKTFPDQPYTPDSTWLTKIEEKEQSDRTAIEQKLLDTVHKYMMAGLNMMPTGHFVEDHTQEGTFRYLGKGVDLGNSDRIICWYKLEGSDSYRAIYGDLTVRDVTADDLPLSVEP